MPLSARCQVPNKKTMRREIAKLYPPTLGGAKRESGIHPAGDLWTDGFRAQTFGLARNDGREPQWNQLPNSPDCLDFPQPNFPLVTSH